MAKKKMKKGWIIFLIIFCVIALPIGVTYGLFFDVSTKDVKQDPNYSIEKMGEKIIVDSLDHTSEEPHLISFKLEEDIIDQVLMSAKGEIPAPFSNYVKKIYVDVDTNKYNFYLDIAVPLFQTRVCLLTELDVEMYDIEFTIEDVKVGRVGGFSWVIDKFITDDILTNAFASTGLSIKSNIKERKLTYNINDFVSDLERLGVLGGDDIFSSMIKEFINNDQLVTFNVYNGEPFGININLTELHANSSEDENYDLNLDLDLVRTATIEDIVSTENFEKTTDNIKSLFESNFRNIFSSTLSGHRTIKEVAVSQINASSITSGTSLDVVITEEDINNYFKMSDILGNTIIFHREDGNTHKVNYFTVDNFYVNLFEENYVQCADFVLGLNVNGYETVISVKTPFTGVNNNKLTFSLEEATFNFGSIDISDNLKNYFIDYLANGISCEDDQTIKLSDDRSEIVVDFTSIISSSNKASFIEENCDIAVTMYGEVRPSQEAGFKIRITSN